ncbi:3-dehydroquinate dehydratase [Aminomonas paucivorans DSM 12260]|uniref:3-dehydroquinate dehydratase n=1 Tax=Aminomonas paucivorans DSM 12260 TaxID=584708 RepID=E3CV77_9BACT|nr:type II 3-dehydroquinate dehydratase [Aminomonas paucivorans]EFQ24164.1 3-dehydroquinate dehydratase [Aminomonas paucivorans DSM 12260]
MGTRRFLVLNGPNLNLLGEREPEVYGSVTLEEVEVRCRRWGEERGVELRFAQSNHEGVLLDRLQEARRDCAGGVFNPGAYTHTSVALRDCVAALRIPVVEVHLSNTHAREPFRRRSLLAPVAAGRVEGFGAAGYLLALEGLLGILRERGL